MVSKYLKQQYLKRLQRGCQPVNGTKRKFNLPSSGTTTSKNTFWSSLDASSSTIILALTPLRPKTDKVLVIEVGVPGSTRQHLGNVYTSDERSYRYGAQKHGGGGVRGHPRNCGLSCGDTDCI